MKATCPACFFEFEIDDNVMRGEIIECGDCGIELEVVDIKKDQAVLQKAESEDEDWGE